MKYFEVFKMKPKFLLEDIDTKNIEETFLTLQKENVLHDGTINLQTRIINEAYNTIMNDVKRIGYIFKILNIDVETIKMNQDLIENILELREDLEDSETEEELKTKIKDIIIEFEEVKQDLNDITEKALNNENYKQSILFDLFCRFKCLNEIIKKYKNHTL